MAKVEAVHAKWGNSETGLLIQEAGQGGGFVALPDVLDDYEKALGLEIEETWFLKRFLRYYWKAGTPIYPAFSEISRNCNMSEKTIRKWRNSLVEKGFLQLVGTVGGLTGKPDNRVVHDINPFFFALAICVLCDPFSRVTKKNQVDGEAVDYFQILTRKPAIDFFEKVELLPLSLQAGRAIAEFHKVNLDWSTIAQMQGMAEIRKAEVDTERTLYYSQLKELVLEAGINAVWGYKDGFEFLRFCWDNGVPLAALEAFLQTNDIRNFKILKERVYELNWKLVNL